MILYRNSFLEIFEITVNNFNNNNNNNDRFLKKNHNSYKHSSFNRIL